LLDLSIINSVEGESFHDIDHFVTFFLLANTPFFLENLEYGLACGDINTHLIGNSPHGLAALNYAGNNNRTNFLTDLFVGITFILLRLTHMIINLRKKTLAIEEDEEKKIRNKINEINV